MGIVSEHLVQLIAKQVEDRVNVWVQRRRNTPKLQLEWLDPDTGKRRSKSSGTSDPEEGERKRQELEYELNHGLHHAGPGQDPQRPMAGWELAGWAADPRDRGYCRLARTIQAIRPDR